MIAQDSTDIQQEILNRVDVVAQKFSEIAPEAWEILVRQQMIEGSIWVAVVLIGAVGVYLSRPRKPRESCFEDMWSGPQDGFYHFLVWIVLAVAALVGVVGLLASGLGQLLNPEYYALMELKP